MFALILFASAFALPITFVPQNPTTPAVPWTTNRLPDLSPARTVSTTPVALPAPASSSEFRLKIAATRHSGDGVLVVAISRVEGTPACFEATIDPDGRALLELDVRGDDVRVCRGGRSVTPSGAKSPTDARVHAWTSSGAFQLDAVYHYVAQAREPVPRPAGAPAPIDPLARLGKGSRWNGTFTGDQSEIDCAIVVVDRTANTLTFRLELENGARFRVDCKVDDAKLAVEKITHTKSATNGRLRIITNENGRGTVSPVAFALDYTYHSEMPNKKETMRGKIRITFPK